MNTVKTILGLKEIYNNYDTFILDQWGVLHDGKRGYKHSIKCVDNLFQNNKKLIIISNSSKRKENTIKRLPKLGFNPKYFLEVMTSGEMIWQSLYKKNHNFIKKIKKNCYFIYDQSKNDSKDFIKGLERYNFVKKIEDADFILACSTTPGLNTIDYVPILIKAIEKLDNWRIEDEKIASNYSFNNNQITMEFIELISKISRQENNPVEISVLNNDVNIKLNDVKWKNYSTAQKINQNNIRARIYSNKKE